MLGFPHAWAKWKMHTIRPVRRGHRGQGATHWANFNKKVHKPPYWTLEVARVKKQD